MVPGPTPNLIISLAHSHKEMRRRKEKVSFGLKCSPSFLLLHGGRSAKQQQQQCFVLDWGRDTYVRTSTQLAILGCHENNTPNRVLHLVSKHGWENWIISAYLSIRTRMKHIG